MIANYLKTAMRLLLRQKSYSIINIGGLAIGMSVCILILTYVFNELSYDRFHGNSDQIYRLGLNASFGGNAMILAPSSPPMGPALVKDYPEILAATRLNINEGKTLINIGDKKFFQSNILYADSSFFHVFSFKLLSGEKSSALSNFKSVVLTETTAKKFFGNEHALGKTIKINDQFNYTVTGIMEDVPANSHLNFELIFSIDFNDPESRFHNTMDWGNISIYTYLLLEKNVDIKALQSKFPEFEDRYMSEMKAQDIKINLFLQPLNEIHLYSKLEYDIDGSGDITYVYLFSAVALFILFIACINYTNLASARSFRRAKEVGMRKIHGAVRGQIIKQFIGESMLFSILALLISILIVELALPGFNQLVYSNSSINLFDNLVYILIFFIGISFVVGILAGTYPALYMSSFSPISALKGEKIKGKRKSLLRNSLVVLQFSIAVVLIICTGVIFNQLNYVKNKDLGFKMEDRIVIPFQNDQTRAKIELLKNEFEQLSLIENVSRANGLPAISGKGSGYMPEGTSGKAPMIIYNFGIDDKYLDVLDMKIVEGRNFSSLFGTDSLSIIVNERLCKIMNWAQPIGKKISRDNETPINYTVIGVVKDFHFRSLLSQIDPFLFHYTPNTDDYLVLKFKRGYFNEALQQVKTKWADLTNSAAFDHISIKENYEKQYDSYLKMGKLFTVFTIIAIFIACIGLFGLASFLTEIRTKEIGIRKVNGAGVFKILQLLNTDFLKWVLVANIIAWPVAWYFMNEWLNKFSYQIKLSWYYFVLGAVLSVVVALITVSYQSIKSATQNPVISLKYE